MLSPDILITLVFVTMSLPVHTQVSNWVITQEMGNTGIRKRRAGPQLPKWHQEARILSATGHHNSFHSLFFVKYLFLTLDKLKPKLQSCPYSVCHITYLNGLFRPKWFYDSIHCTLTAYSLVWQTISSFKLNNRYLWATHNFKWTHLMLLCG